LFVVNLVNSLYLALFPRFTVYVTACDLEKSFSFDNTIAITRHVLIHV